jgi:thiol-disulfide isomerase/thioredoxin
MALFAPFFEADLLPTPSARDMGMQEIGGAQLNTVSVQMPSMRNTAIASFSRDDDSLKQATISGFFDSQHAGQNRVQQCVLEAKSLTFSDTIDKTPYVFKPPSGARGISVTDTPSDTWYTDLELAGAIAAATNRRIFVDFMATWCGPCKQLHDQVLSTDYFRSLSQYFVFVQIDVDKQSKVSGSYQVTAMPTQMVLDAQGGVLGKTVGFGGPKAFYDFLSKFAGG